MSKNSLKVEIEQTQHGNARKSLDWIIIIVILGLEIS